MLKPFLTGVGLVLVAARLSGAGAEVPFITAGFPQALETIPMDPTSLWFLQPAGQEFVSALPQVDFVELQLQQGSMPPGTSNHYQVILHADTILGPFVWASETVARPRFDISLARFSFDPPVEIMPWARYVVELVRQEPIQGWQDSPQVGFVSDILGNSPALHYGGGRAVLAAEPIEESDMFFRAGVMVQSMWSTNVVRVLATGAPQAVDPGARFTNEFITTLNTATLSFQMDQPLGTNEDLQFNSSVVRVDPGTNVLSVFYDGFFRAVGVVLTNAPGDRPSLAMRFTTEPPFSVVGLILRSVEFVARPDAANGLWPTVHTNTLRVTFKHEAGEVTDAMQVNFQAVNQPPAAQAVALGGNDFLERSQVFFTRRTETNVEVSLTMQVTDVDSTNILVRWQKQGSTNVAGVGLQLTGTFGAGRYTFGGTVRDEEHEVAATPTTFEVVEPRQGVVQLRGQVRARVALRRRYLVAGPLDFVETAVRRRHWKVAEQYLRVFQRRAERQVPEGAVQDLLTHAAQVLIDDALK